MDTSNIDFNIPPPPGLTICNTNLNNINSFCTSPELAKLEQDLSKLGQDFSKLGQEFINSLLSNIKIINSNNQKTDSLKIKKIYNLHTCFCKNGIKCEKILINIIKLMLNKNFNDDDDDDDNYDENDNIYIDEKYQQLYTKLDLSNLDNLKSYCNFYHSDFEIKQMIILISKCWNKNIYKFIKKIKPNFTNKLNTIHEEKYIQKCIFGENCWSCIINNNCLKYHTKEELLNIDIKRKTIKLKNIFNINTCKHQNCFYHIQGKCKFYHTPESEQILKTICNNVGHLFGTSIELNSVTYKNIIYELKYISNS